MSKHTPGPWVKDLGTVGHIKSVAPHDYGMQPTVARYDLTAPLITNQEREANARLIAKAPEMYQFLQDAAWHTPPAGSDPYLPACKALADYARAILAEIENA